jgi:hypothetical protein
VLATSTGYDVLIALIAGVPAILAAIFAGVVALRTRMPNGTKIGNAIAESHATATENNALLKKLNGQPADEGEA